MMLGFNGALPAHAFAQDAPPSAEDPDKDYDRLDGTGSSGKTVQVIEWEGNLEIHAFPSGSLKSLSLKLDDRNRDKPVMVIGYRFNDRPGEQLIRRAILGIPLRTGFQAFRDPSEREFDKVLISNNGLASPLLVMKLEPEPSQLYPDGHPLLEQATNSSAHGTSGRAPASASVSATESASATLPASTARAHSASAFRQGSASVPAPNEDGTIRAFQW